VTDNTSPIRFIQARFGLGALTRRDANAWPLLDFFDFSKPQMLVPPALPQPKFSTDPAVQAQVQACIKKFGK
jgi:phospholipase C